MPIHGPSCFLHVQLGLGFAERVSHLVIPTIKSLNCQNYPGYFYLTFLGICHALRPCFRRRLGYSWTAVLQFKFFFFALNYYFLCIFGLFWYDNVKNDFKNEKKNCFNAFPSEKNFEKQPLLLSQTPLNPWMLFKLMRGLHVDLIEPIWHYNRTEQKRKNMFFLIHKVKIDLKVILEYLYSCQFQ